MKLKRSKTLISIKKEGEEKSNLKKKIVKSLSGKNLYKQKHLIFKEFNSISPQNIPILKLPDNDSEKSSVTNSKEVKLPRILSSDDLISNIRLRLIKNKHLAFFIKDENGLRINKTDNRVLNYKKRTYLKKASKFNEFLNYNVFNEKDEKIKDIIDTFNIQMSKKKINKVKRRKLILNQLYGITPEYNKIIKTSKSQKNLSLEDYQDNLLNALNSNGMYSNETIGELYQKFKNLKIDVENVIPYPKINIKKIIKHFKKDIKKNNKVMSIKEFLSKRKEPEDEFEKEEKNIISLKIKKNNNPIFRIQHDNLYMLPNHIRNLFRK